MKKEYWIERYQNQQTGWDIGYVSTPLKEYIDQLVDKRMKILIPGAGNAYEAEYLFTQGFKNVYVLDISEAPLEAFSARNPTFPKGQLILGNFFDLEGTFDLILEQTFFCALTPKLRGDYALKMHQLLKPKGKLVGLLFDFPLTEKGPPFGGDSDEYRAHFTSYFEVLTLERSYNSIKPRVGKELFFRLQKKSR